MSKPASTKPETPSWAVISPELFTLSPEEAAVIERHREIWREFASGGRPSHGDAIEREWQDALNAARHGDVQALELVEKFGSPMHLQRYREAAEEGRTARFHAEHAGNLREHRPMIERCGERVEALLADYKAVLGHPARAALGIPASTGDDVTRRLEALRAKLLELLNWEPKGFELLENHLGELVEA